MSWNKKKGGSIDSPILEFGRSTKASRMSTKDKSSNNSDSSLPKGNRNMLGLFKIKPISSFLTSDDQFEFVMNLGENVKHLQPVPPEVLQDAENDKIMYESKLLQMKNLTLDTTVKDVDKPSLIHHIGIEAKELLISITEHNTMCKELNRDKTKVQNALLNATKAVSYWKNEDAVKYGEWLIIEMVGKRLLEMHTMAEAAGKRKRVSLSFDGRVNGQAASIPIDIDTEVVTNNGVNNGGDITVIDIDNILPPAKKATPDRVVMRKVVDTKYKWSKEYPRIEYVDFKNQVNGGKQGK